MGSRCPWIVLSRGCTRNPYFSIFLKATSCSLIHWAYQFYWKLTEIKPKLVLWIHILRLRPSPPLFFFYQNWGGCNWDSGVEVWNVMVCKWCYVSNTLESLLWVLDGRKIRKYIEQNKYKTWIVSDNPHLYLFLCRLKLWPLFLRLV